MGSGPSNLRLKATKPLLELIDEKKNETDEIVTIRDLIFPAGETVVNSNIINVYFYNCIMDYFNFKHSKFEGVSFNECSLKSSDFYSATLYRCAFEGSNLYQSNFSDSKSKILKIHNSNAEMTVFRNSKITDSTFVLSELSESIFTSSVITKSRFCSSNLKYSKFNCVSFSNSDFFECNLRGVDFSESNGLLNPIDYLENNFQWVNAGVIVYKKFNYLFVPSKSWHIGVDSIITEEPNYDRTSCCASGINVGSKSWIKENILKERADNIWKCIILNKWLPGVVVPYGANGKIRTSKLMLLNICDKSEFGWK